ncbi:hypothetical protein ACKZDW_02450 (plasmid) [Ralstonia syzygii subsp. celebesensis]|uniref:STY1053 family phage-associated protein n=1 Tax=Ralstonia syzygii TaxID=28097 RepID=UPI00387E0B01
MPKIYIKTAFTLTHEDGTKVPFPVGEHEVDADVADHWYVKAHAGEKPVAGAPASAAEDSTGDDANGDNGVAKAELDARAAELAKFEVALSAREAELDAREDAIAKREAAIAAATAEQAAADRAKGDQKPQPKK